MAGEGDLAPRIAALGDVAFDPRDQPVDLLAPDAQRLEIGGGQGKAGGGPGLQARVHGYSAGWGEGEAFDGLASSTRSAVRLTRAR